MDLSVLKKACFLFLGMGFSVTYAQHSPVATGGDASGSGGSAAYSVGQVVYTAVDNTNGMVSQGVQQAYSISVISGIDIRANISIDLVAYPNPVTDVLVLKITGTDLKDLSYALYDIGGKLIESKDISSVETKLNMVHLPGAGYVLKVNNNDNPIKAFQIIKN